MKTSKNTLKAICSCIIAITAFTGCSSIKYDDANKMYNEGKYEEAREVYLELKDYEQSEDMVKACDYEMAKRLFEDKQFEEAMAAFKEMGDYSDSETMVNECKYQKAESLLSTGNDDDKESAVSIFLELGEYKDSKTRYELLRFKDFNDLFSDISKNKWCKISSDGTWMQLDTNPNNTEEDDMLLSDYSLMFDCCDAIEKVNETLGFSTALMEKMNKTTWSQGVLEDSNDKYKVSWTYHPDKGLEVMYEFKR